MQGPDNSGSHRVLIVDDDQLTALALMRALKADDLNILAVAEGPHALSEIRTKVYSLVFLEICIADGTGMTVLQEISRSSPSTCLIVMSAGIPNGEMENTIIKYDHFFLPKPFEILQVRTMVRKILSKTPPALQDSEYMEEGRRERRQGARRPQSGQVICQSDPEKSYLGIPSRFAAEFLDVSPDGIGIRTDLPLPPGQTFRFKDDAGANEGIVRWSMVFENRFRAGIQFV